MQELLTAEEGKEIYFSLERYPFQEESYKIIGLCMEVHKILGKGFSEMVYKDTLEFELKSKGILYKREKKYEVTYKNIILPHHYIADFVITDKIILEVKAQECVLEEHYSQVLNYLAISKLKLGLLINFGEDSLKFKRLVL